MRDVLVNNKNSKEVLQFYEHQDAQWQEFMRDQDDEANQDVDETEKPEKPSLSNFQRDVLVDAIVSHIKVEIGHVPGHHLFPILTKKLVEIFPTENEVSPLKKS